MKMTPNCKTLAQKNASCGPMFMLKWITPQFQSVTAIPQRR